MSSSRFAPVQLMISILFCLIISAKKYPLERVPGQLILLYFFRIFITASCGRPGTVLSLIPFIVLPATNALIIASSVASIVAVNNSFIRSLEYIVTLVSLVLLNADLLAVENAMKISPEPLPPMPPFFRCPN